MNILKTTLLNSCFTLATLMGACGLQAADRRAPVYFGEMDGKLAEDRKEKLTDVGWTAADTQTKNSWSILHAWLVQNAGLATWDDWNEESWKGISHARAQMQELNVLNKQLEQAYVTAYGEFTVAKKTLLVRSMGRIVSALVGSQKLTDEQLVTVQVVIADIRSLGAQVNNLVALADEQLKKRIIQQHAQSQMAGDAALAARMQQEDKDAQFAQSLQATTQEQERKQQQARVQADAAHARSLVEQEQKDAQMASRLHEEERKQHHGRKHVGAAQPKKEARSEAQKKSDAQDLNAMGATALKYTNEFRAKHKLPALKWCQQLAQVSMPHSKSMGNRNSMDHLGAQERFNALKNPQQRGAAENVLWCLGVSGDLARHAVDGWIASPPHCKALKGDYTHCAIAVYKNAKGAYYFTQMFAKY